MNDLISKSKLLAWLKAEYAKEYPEGLAAYVNGRKTILDILELRVEGGDFAPDPEPIPDIPSMWEMIKAIETAGVKVNLARWEEDNHLHVDVNPEDRPKAEEAVKAYWNIREQLRTGSEVESPNEQ